MAFSGRKWYVRHGATARKTGGKSPCALSAPSARRRQFASSRATALFQRENPCTREGAVPTSSGNRPGPYAVRNPTARVWRPDARSGVAREGGRSGAKNLMRPEKPDRAFDVWRLHPAAARNRVWADAKSLCAPRVFALGLSAITHCLGNAPQSAYITGRLPQPCLH